MNNTSHLLLGACSAFKDAAQSLNGPLERAVEASASACWVLRERSVQIKGRFMRTKTLIVEDPVFQDDAEHDLGDNLSKWEEQGAVAVAAAALETKIAQQRLHHATRKILLEKTPERLLEALDSILKLYEDVHQLETTVSDAVEKEFYQTSLQFIQQIAFQLSSAYLAAVSTDGGGSRGTRSSSPPSTQAVASLASIIARYGSSSEWTVGFLQPGPSDVLPVLLTLSEERKQSSFSPVAILRILGQLEVSSIEVLDQFAASKDAHVLPRALIDIIHFESEEGNGVDGGGISASAMVVSQVLLQLAKQSSEQRNDTLASSVAESLLELLLAASKGISTTTLRQQESINNKNISSLADWIFSFRPRYVVHQNLILQILASLPWEWLAQQCPRNLRLRWLLAAVSTGKALHEGEDRSSGGAAAAVHALSEVMSSTVGWSLAIECFKSDETAEQEQQEQQGRMLCLLEAPLSEPPAVLLLWRQVQATVALSLCTTWIQTINTRETSLRESINDDITTLLEGARVCDALTLQLHSRHSTAALSILSHVVNSSISSTPEFMSTLYPTLSLTLSAALSGSSTIAAAATPTSTATATALVKVLEKGISESVRACDGNDDSFASLAAWIGLFVGTLAQRDGFQMISTNPVVAKLIRTAYSLISDKRRLAWVLLYLSNALQDQPRSQTQQIIAQLLGSGGGELFAWLRVLGAWIADAVSLSSKMPQQGTASWSITDAIAVLEEATTTTRESTAEHAEAAANEVFLLQDAIQSIQSTAPIPATVLCYALLYRISNNYVSLSPLLDRQQLTTSLASVSRVLEINSPELANLVTSLLKLLDQHESEVTLEIGLLPFVGNFSAVDQVATVYAPAWLEHDWKKKEAYVTTSTDVVESSSSFDKVRLPPKQPSPPHSAADSVDFLRHQQEDQASALSTALYELRYWVRQGEKQAARPEGEDPLPDQGKEGDIPQPLATSQRHLWELEQRQREELSTLHASLRQKVCQQYNPIDEQFLQEASEAFSDGDRIPRAMLYRDSQHALQCRQLREQAVHVALSTDSAKEVSLAAKELFTFEYLLLEAVEKGEVTQERANIRSKLLAVLAHSLVDGSTPVTAMPYMVGLFERAVLGGGVVLDSDAKLRLIPRIAANLSSRSTNSPVAGGGGGGGGSSVLREKEGMRLLNACLDPDALLNAGKLREFMTALQLLVSLQTGSSADQPSVMLGSFDAQRFAVLVAEKPGSVRASTAGGSGSGSGSSASTAAASSSLKKSKEVGIEEVLTLAAECLTTPQSAPTGSALLEGILNISPVPLYAACLGVVLNAPATGRKDTMLSMLSQVPLEMLDPPVVAEALSLLTQSLINGRLDPPDLPYGLLGALVRAVPVLESLRAGMETSKAVQSAVQSSGGRKKSESFTMKKAAFTITTTNATAITLQSISASYTPLGILAENALQAAMRAVLRTFHSGNGSSDVAQPLLALIFELAGVCGLEWIWAFYQTHLCTFIADADKAISSTACAAAFQQFWASLPWKQSATFHVESPREIAKIRAYLPSSDYAAARLVHDLDWKPVLDALLPPAKVSTKTCSGRGAGGGASSGAAPGVFTLLDETEDDNALITSAISPTHQQQQQNSNLVLGHSINLNQYSQKQWATELALLLLHCSVFLPDSPIGIPEWAQNVLLGSNSTTTSREGTTITTTSLSDIDEVGAAGGADIILEDEDEEVGIIRLLAASDWHLIESTITTTTIGKVPWLVLPLLLAPQSIYGDVGQRVVHAGYVLSKAAEKDGSATAARAVVQAVRPLLAFSICQGIQISMDQQMQALGGSGGAGSSRLQDDAETAAALAASIASHQLVDIPADIPEELLEGTVELEQLRLQREQIRISEEEAAAAAAAAASAAAGSTEPQSSVPAAQLIEVSGCFRFTPVQHVTLLRDVLGPLAAKHAQRQLTISSITAEQCAPFLEPPSPENEEAVVVWDSPLLSSFAATSLEAAAEEEFVAKNKKGPSSSAAVTDELSAVAAMLCVSLLQPLVMDPLIILTQTSLSYCNTDLPWVVENTSKAVFISSVFSSGGGGRQSVHGGSMNRPGRSMRALRQQISSLLHRRDGIFSSSSVSRNNNNQRGISVSSAIDDPEDAALNQAVTDALSLRSLMGHVVEDAAVRAVYSVQHGKRLGACLLRCIVLTPSVYYSAFVAHVGENILRGLASPSSSSSFPDSTHDQLHAAEQVPVIEAVVENTPSTTSSTTTTTGMPGFISAVGNIPISESMSFASMAASNLEPSYLLQFAQATARMRRPLLTAYALASARHAATLLDKTAWQALAIDALKVIHESESNAEHPLEVIAPWLESLKWIGDTRWRRLPPGQHKVALNDLLSSLDNRFQVIEVLNPEELSGDDQRQQRGERKSSSSSLLPSSMQQQQQQQQVAVSSGGPVEDPSLTKKFASGFRSIGKSVTQAGTKLKNKLADGDGTSTSSITHPTVTTLHVSSHQNTVPIDPERDHLVRVGLAAYAITSYIRSVMDTKLTRRTMSGAEPSSPKHLRAASLTSNPMTMNSVHIRGNSSLTGSRHLEEAQISELDTVLEAREAVDYLEKLEASPLLAQHRELYAAFLDRMTYLLTAKTGVETFVLAVVRLLVPNADDAEKILILLTHSGA